MSPIPPLFSSYSFKRNLNKNALKCWKRNDGSQRKARKITLTSYPLGETVNGDGVGGDRHVICSRFAFVSGSIQRLASIATGLTRSKHSEPFFLAAQDRHFGRCQYLDFKHLLRQIQHRKQRKSQRVKSGRKASSIPVRLANLFSLLRLSTAPNGFIINFINCHPMELYYVPESPPCRAVLLTIKALEVDVCLRKLDMFQKAEHKRAWFLKLNPMHKVPTLEDNGFVIWESRAIMTYLAQKYQKTDSLYPSDPQKRAAVDKMLYFDIGTLYKSISDYWVFGKQTPDSQKANALKQSLDYLDRFLEDTGYAAADHVTLADFSLLASVTTLEAYGYDYSGYSNVQKWVNCLKNQLDHYEECIQKGVDSAKVLYQSILKNNN